MKKIILFLFLLLQYQLFAGKAVSLSPTVTQLILYLGGAERLAGKSSACYFPELSHIPAVGDLGRPFPETVLSTGAALVISDARHPDANWDILKRCAVSVEILDTSSVSRLPENLRRLGTLLNIDGAEQKAAAVEEKIAALRRSLPEKMCRAVILFGTAPLISCGKDTFISDTLQLAGVKNLAADTGRGYFILTPEFLYSADPDVLIIIGVPESIARYDLENGLLRSLPAVKKRRFIFPDADQWSKLTPEIINAAEKLRHHLHP